jgi:hypothetical protein
VSVTSTGACLELPEMTEKVYHYRPLPAMEWRTVTSCDDCGHFIFGNGFTYHDNGISGFCDMVPETDLSEYKYKIVEDQEKIPDWCPLPDQHYPKRKKKHKIPPKKAKKPEKKWWE